MGDEKYFIFLDTLQESGVTNMFGASKYLVDFYKELDKYKAREILSRWMESFDERHPYI